MIRFLRSCCLSACLLCLCCGCSYAIANGGKHVESELSAGATRAKIEQMIGKPQSETAFTDSSAATTKTSTGASVIASSVANYHFKGRADDLYQFEEMGMLDGMTLGLGEVVAFPWAIERSRQLQNNLHDYRVWYDASEKCVAYEVHHSGWGEGD